MLRIGPEELAKSPLAYADASPVPFTKEVLSKHDESHILIFTPHLDATGKPISLLSLREKFGTDPEKGEPCFYNQDWYLKEDFASEPLNGKWHLISKDVLEEARAKAPETIDLKGEAFPSAATLAFAFFAYWFHTGGEKLWKHDFLWCSDSDHNSDRIYVGRYIDPSGINKNGFNVHRHLSLKPWFSAAPEIV